MELIHLQEALTKNYKKLTRNLHHLQLHHLHHNMLLKKFKALDSRGEIFYHCGDCKHDQGETNTAWDTGYDLCGACAHEVKEAQEKAQGKVKVFIIKSLHRVNISILISGALGG